MAKKSKRKASTKRRTGRRGRGRVGAIGGGVPLEMMGAALGGGLLGRVATNVTKNVGFIRKKPIFRVAIKGLACYYLLTQKSPMMTAVGLGLAGETALDAAGQFAPDVFGPAPKQAVGATIIDLDNPINGTNDDYNVAGMSNDDMAVAGAY